jgi:hypothetical protein
MRECNMMKMYDNKNMTKKNRHKASQFSNILRGGIFFLFLSLTTIVFGQQTETKAFATLDSNVVTIGDKVTLNIGVLLDPTSRVIGATPDLPIDTSKFGAIDLGQWGKEKNRLPNFSRTLVFQPFDTGLYRIPSVIFTIEEANGVKTTAESPSLLLTVNNPDGADALVAPVDIKPIATTDWTFEEDMWPFLKAYLPYFILAIAVLFLAWRFWQRWKNRQLPPVVQQISRPPHEIAERLLAELRAKKLWENGKTKAFYSELSHILRGYLEDRFTMPALESTTEELIRDLKTRGFDAALIDKIRNLLQTADLVKFAKVEPPTDVHDAFLGDAEHIVEITKPQPVVNEEIAKVETIN